MSTREDWEADAHQDAIEQSRIDAGVCPTCADSGVTSAGYPCEECDGEESNEDDAYYEPQSSFL